MYVSTMEKKKTGTKKKQKWKKKNTKRRNDQAKGLSSNNLKNTVKHLFVLSQLSFEQSMKYRRII